ncbi:MAG TPA: DUF4139 domain-containing protein [Myxococcales bacterium]|jgi:hypothetical protein
MRASILLVLPLAAAVLGCAHEPPKPVSSEAVLPLKRARLYETGIGYFERTGAVGAVDQIGLPVPASHLDDALKSLVVLGSDNQKPVVQAIEFPTSMAEGMARARAGLSSNGTPLDMKELLTSLKGEKVRVTLAREQVSGRVLDVVEDPPARSEAGKGARSGKLAVVLLTDSSAIRYLDTDGIAAVRPDDPAQVARLGAALTAISTKSRAQRLMHVLAQSPGTVTLGYIAEAPLWRPTYRLVLEPTGKRGVLQAWALLHNDTDEDWSQVRVELVNGRPTSFLYPLAAPRYARRGLAHPEDAFSTVPQLLGKTADSLWGDFVDDASDGSGVAELGGRRVDVGIAGDAASQGGEGGGMGRVAGVKAGDEPSDALSVGNLAATDQARGAESGALFVYSLPTPLSLGRQSSALVPFLQQSIEVETLAFIDSPGEPARSGVRILNGTGQTLPAGPLATFADGGLAGEGALDRLKPAQRQIVQYGADLDVSLVVKVDSLKVREDTRRVAFADDRLEEHYLRTTESVFVVENRGGQARSIYVGLPVIDNGKVTGADRLEREANSAKTMAVFRLEARKKVERPMTFEEGFSRTTSLKELRADGLKKLASNELIPEADRKAVAEAAVAQARAEETANALAKLNVEIARIGKDLERLRGHLEAASGKGASPATGNPFVQRILAAEDRLESLRKKGEELTAAGEAQRNEVRGSLKKLGR